MQRVQPGQPARAVLPLARQGRDRDPARGGAFEGRTEGRRVEPARVERVRPAPVDLAEAAARHVLGQLRHGLVDLDLERGAAQPPDLAGQPRVEAAADAAPSVRRLDAHDAPEARQPRQPGDLEAAGVADRLPGTGHLGDVAPRRQPRRLERLVERPQLGAVAELEVVDQVARERGDQARDRVVVAAGRLGQADMNGLTQNRTF